MLELNVDARSGHVQVEILDQNSKPLPGFSADHAPVSKAVDELRFQPAWKTHKDLSALRGKVVRIRFNLRDATLYAFQVGVGAGRLGR